MPSPGLPLAPSADEMLERLAAATGVSAFSHICGATLLGERALLGGMRIPGRISAGGGCRLFEALGDTIALNLARAADRELLPALLATDTSWNTDDDAEIARRFALRDAEVLVSRGRTLGLAIAAVRENLPSPAKPCHELVAGGLASTEGRRAPRVLDLSSLWAGPLTAHLLWIAGAEVIKVESRTRPDAMRAGDPVFYALLNQGKSSVVLDFSDSGDRRVLLSLIAASDIVIEASRPRALMHLGIDAAEIVRATPGLVWLSITGHGVEGDARDWVGFGDDCGVAGGLTEALHAAAGRMGFVGDAIGDPLTGLWASLVAWEAWSARRGGRFGLAMSHVVARCLATSRETDPMTLDSSLRAWDAAQGQPFPAVNRRPIGPLPVFGEHTHFHRERVGQS